LPDSSSPALTPMMSAPASASPRAMAKPMPRRQPVTTATLPVRSNRCDTESGFGSGIGCALAVDQDLHFTAAFQRVERLVDLADRYHPGDELVGWDGSLRQEVDGTFDVPSLVDARPDDGQLPPEQPEEVHLARLRVDRDHHQASAGGQ